MKTISNLYAPGTVHAKRIDTDALFIDDDAVCRFTGLLDRTARYIADFQLMDPVHWARFVNQFKIHSDNDGAWRGEYWGKMMRGAAFTYAYLRDPALYQAMTDTVEDMLTAIDDQGRISTCSVAHEFRGWDIWCRKYVLLGMQYFLEVCTDDDLKSRILASMMRQVDYIRSKIGPKSEGKTPITEATRNWRGMNSSSLLEPVVRLYDLTGDQRYRDAIETIRGQLETQPRTKEGNFWHKKIYPNQVWLDGTYMAQPFYMEYETRCNGMHGCIDSYKQFMNIQKHMKDAKTGLYYHGYDESREMYWANPETGCSANFWLRAMGWFLVAMVDTLERMDNQLYYEYRAIMAMLKDAVDAMIAFQDAESGMFWQVVDKAGVEGNYLETSGSALFAYAVLKGVRLGYLPKRYTAYGEKAFYGTCDRHLGVGADGALQLGGICLVAGLGGATRRDGSLAYYFSEPIVENDAKGVGPLLLAYTEILAAQKQ